MPTPGSAPPLVLHRRGQGLLPGHQVRVRSLLRGRAGVVCGPRVAGGAGGAEPGVGGPAPGLQSDHAAAAAGRCGGGGGGAVCVPTPAFTSRDDGGVKAGSDDDSVVESGATGDEGGGDVGGGSATKDPTARAPIIGDHYVALADGSKQARAVERGVARHPLLLPGWRR